MFTTPLTKKSYLAVGVIIFFMITNPSRSSFGSYLHRTEYDGIGRDFNGLIFSVYSYQNSRPTGKYHKYNGRALYEDYKVFYIGILGNFFKSPF